MRKGGFGVKVVSTGFVLSAATPRLATANQVFANPFAVVN